MKEMNPLCVLDIYTYEGCQRKGYGKEIYTAMIKAEKTEPRKLGYDRPSFKFLNFLKKYYNLEEYVPQNNNFVVFNDFTLFLLLVIVKSSKTLFAVHKESPLSSF